MVPHYLKSPYIFWQELYTVSADMCPFFRRKARPSFILQSYSCSRKKLYSLLWDKKKILLFSPVTRGCTCGCFQNKKRSHFLHLAWKWRQTYYFFSWRFPWVNTTTPFLVLRVVSSKKNIQMANLRLDFLERVLPVMNLVLNVAYSTDLFPLPPYFSFLEHRPKYKTMFMYQ